MTDSPDLSRLAFAPPTAGARPGGRAPGARIRGLISTLAGARRRLPAVLPPLLFLPLVLAPPLNHDVAAVLQFSQRWLAGERLGVDLIDVNPPLIFVLNLAPAALAAATGIGAVAALQLCVLLLGACCWWLSARVRDRNAEPAVTRAVLDMLPLLFCLGAGYDFAQREHLMTITAVPYLLSAARRARGEAPRHRVLTGVVAGIGFAIKPYFLGVPLLVELAVLAARARRAALRDCVPWSMAAVWLGYAACLPLLFPEYLRLVLPMIRADYLDLGGLTPWQMLLLPRMATALILLVPLLWSAARAAADEAVLARRPRYRPTLARLLALAAVAAVISAEVQHKGWSYHILPIELFAGALGAVLAADWLDRLRPAWPPGVPARIAGVLAALILLYSVSNGEAPWKQLEYLTGDSDVAGLVALLRRAAPDQRVLVLSPGVWPIYPALNYAGDTQTLRTMDIWLLEGAYADCLPGGRRYRDPGEMDAVERFAFRTTAEDFARAPPAAVVVDTETGIPWCGRDFDFIDYFSRDPLFARTWQRYRLFESWQRYRVYTRRD
jgi:hypothetical protein